MSYLFCAFYCRWTLIVPIRSILALSSRWSQSVRGNRYFSVLSKVWPVIENSSLRFLDYEVVLHFKLLRYNRKLLIISEARRLCCSPHPRNHQWGLHPSLDSHLHVFPLEYLLEKPSTGYFVEVWLCAALCWWKLNILLLSCRAHRRHITDHSTEKPQRNPTAEDKDFITNWRLLAAFTKGHKNTSSVQI